MLKCNMIPLVLISNDSKKIKNYFKNNFDKDCLLYEIEPEKKEYSIEEIKNLRRETGIFNKLKRIYLLQNFHVSSIEAQNAFLKLLEEPPKNVLFVLTTDNEEKLIPTIKSRVKTIHLEKKVSTKLNPKIKEVIEKFIESKGFKFPTEEIALDDIIIFFHDRLKTDKKSGLIIKETLRIKSLLENNNLNKQLAIDHILIFTKKQYTIK